MSFVGAQGERSMKDDIQSIRRSVDAIVGVMRDWAQWQRGYSLKLGYPSYSAGMGAGGTQTFESMCDACDNRAMEAVDAVVQDDLTPIERAAILRRYGVAVVFRFPRENYEEVLMRAHERLMVLLTRKGIIVL